MCHAIEYVREEQRVVVYLDEHRAQLPVRKRSGAIEFVPWGTRGECYLSDDNTPGYLLKFPAGGWATRESIRAGAWQKFEPRPVRIAASRFVYVDGQLGTLYFELESGESIQGLLAQTAAQRRVYVVTVPAPPQHAQKWPWWPRIIQPR